MPIYEYECPSCGHRFEKMVKMNADAPPCPACEGTEVRKLISASGFILQGSGWYKDHYGLKKGDGAKSDAKKADGAKPESKPAGEAKATPAAPKPA